MTFCYQQVREAIIQGDSLFYRMELTRIFTEPGRGFSWQPYLHHIE